MPPGAILTSLLGAMLLPQPGAGAVPPAGEILVDVAARAGLDFVYRNATESYASVRVRVAES